MSEFIREIPEPEPLRILELKTPQELRALAEAYAETVVDPRDQYLLLKALDTLQTLPDLDHLPVDTDTITPELRALIERHRQPYNHFVKEYYAPENRTDLLERKRNADRYAELRPAILPILAEIKERVSRYHANSNLDMRQHYQNLSQLPGFVGMSNRNVVFRLPGSSDQLLVVKVASTPMAPWGAGEKDQIWYAREFQSHLRSLRRVEGMPNCVQLEAWSAVDGVIVMTEALGRTFDMGPAEPGDLLTKAHLQQAVATAIELAERGVAIDGSVSANFFFDPSKGIIFIDFDITERRRLLGTDDEVELDLEIYLEKRRQLQIKMGLPQDGDGLTPQQLIWRQTYISLFEELPVPIALFRAGGYKPEINSFLQHYEGGFGSTRPTDEVVHNGDFELQLKRTKAEINEILKEHHPKIWQRLEAEQEIKQRQEAVWQASARHWWMEFHAEAKYGHDKESGQLFDQLDFKEIDEKTYQQKKATLDAAWPQKERAAHRKAQEMWAIYHIDEDPEYLAASDEISARIECSELTEEAAAPFFDALYTATIVRLEDDFRRKFKEEQLD